MQQQTSTTSDSVSEPAYFTAYENFAVTRTASGVLTVRFHTGGARSPSPAPPTPSSPGFWKTSPSTGPTRS